MNALAVCLFLLAQAAGVPTPPPVAPADADPSGDYHIGPGDVVEVIVFGNADLSRISTVLPNGSINLQLLGEVPVAGLSVTDLQRKLVTLLERDYLVKPQVEVWIREYRSQFATVLGEVHNPGRKFLRGRTRLFDVLVEAGGFTAQASGDVRIERSEGKLAAGAAAVTMHFGGGSLNTLERVNLEVLLKNGDVVTVAPKAYVFVQGEVTKADRYSISEDSKLSEVIARAGGLTRFGKSTLKIRRADGQELKVDLNDIRKKKRPDVKLLPNDTIIVARRLM